MTDFTGLDAETIDKGVAALNLRIAIRTLNEKAIRAQFGHEPPSDPFEFWAGVHRARLNLVEASQEQKDESLKWLMDHAHLPQVSNPPDR